MNKTIIELAKENCPYHSEEMRGAYYDGFVRAAALVRAEAYKNWNPDVTFNEDGTFSLELPDGDELRVIPPVQPVQEPVGEMIDKNGYKGAAWYCEPPITGTQLYTAPVDAKAIRALKLVYDNSTSHDWPEDIWNAIVDALYEEHRKTMATAPQLLGG